MIGSHCRFCCRYCVVSLAMITETKQNKHANYLGLFACACNGTRATTCFVDRRVDARVCDDNLLLHVRVREQH